jgi:hypothetical protein
VRTYRIALANTIAEVPSSIDGVSDYFVLLLAVDAADLTNSQIRDVAKSLLKQGIAYLCVWGPDCERFHDQFDLERNLDEPLNFCVMTTWHSKDTLSDSIDFFVDCACPADGFALGSVEWVAVSIGSRDWLEVIHRKLS